jgi:hypothetical protein
MESLAEGLGALGGTLFRWSAIAFVVVNGIAAATMLLTRSRHLVNRWTPRLLVANLLILGTGIGVPVVTYAMKMVVSMAVASQTTEIKLKNE